MNKGFHKLAKLSVVLVYLVIAAGAVVRMTGSGMGCPDWPRCFGYYIPPTEIETLQWQPDRAFKKGQVIIVDKALKVALTDFTTTPEYNAANWSDYTKHDYAKFNVWHTWIEYINRLLGALAGLATLALAVYAFWFRKESTSLVVLSCLVVVGMGFQAWLGATVVYSVLMPYKITLHMLMALLIVALLLYIVKRSEPRLQDKLDKKHKFVSILLVVALVLTLAQIVLGTQVRELVDHQIKAVGEDAKNLWLQNPNLEFYIHRSFSILVLLVNLYLLVRIRAKKLPLAKINWVAVLLGLEILTGILMYYADFPFASQPIHLVLASILFGVQCYLILEHYHLTVRSKSS